MSQTKFIVRKVAVLGAGVMGAQIAAHLVNAKVPTVLFDLPAKEGDKNAIALKAIEGLKKAETVPAVQQGCCQLHSAGQLRRPSAPAEGLRSGYRGDCRAHGLESRLVRQSGPASG